MSQFLSRVDKTISRCFLTIDLNPLTQFPEKIKLTVLTGVKGNEDKTLEKEEHVAFHFEYKISRRNEVARFDVPKRAFKLMR